MDKRKIKALVLYSGGLDSRLAVKILEEQGIEVLPVLFKLPFSCADCTIPFYKEVLEIDCTKGKLFDEYISLLKDPQFGFGTAINPCVDCKIFIFSKAKELMKEYGCDILASGEVLGERPMSQSIKWLDTIENKIGIEVLKPLSAKVLPETIYEKKGLVDRNKLYEIEGRRRIKQIELAKKFYLDFPSPGGGCVLCERAYASKVTDILENSKNFNANDLKLLKGFRHFRNNEKVILGRNENENNYLINFAKENNWGVIYPIKGPIGIYKDKKDETFTKELVAAYSKKENIEKFDKYKILLEIRPAKKGDLPTLYKLRDELLEYRSTTNKEYTFTESKKESSKKLINTYMKKDPALNIFYLAQIKRKTVGFIHLTKDEKPANGLQGYIQDLYIIPEFRGKGIGTKLLSKAKIWFGKLTYGLACDKEALDFYLKNNFIITNNVKDVYYLKVNIYK